MAGPFAFKSFLYYGSNLTELYMCFTYVNDKDICQIKNSGVDYPFPNLRILCFRGCDITQESIICLLNYCESLGCIYVDGLKDKPINDFSNCDSEKVQVIHAPNYYYHSTDVNYMLE